MIRRVLIILVTIAVCLRAFVFCWYVWFALNANPDVFFLESAMADLAMRAIRGETIYPAWRNYPYVANLYSPLYFWTTAAICGREEQVYFVGRCLSIVPAIISQLFFLRLSAQRFGFFPGLLASLSMWGIVPMIGFASMVRPDLLSDMFGSLALFLVLFGFLNAGLWGNLHSLLAGFLLGVGIMTKQTSAVYLLASVFALLSVGNWRSTVLLLISAGGTIFAVVLVGSRYEPRMLEDMLGQSIVPMTFDFWLTVAKKCWSQAREVVLLPILSVPFLFSRDLKTRIEGAIAFSLWLLCCVAFSKLGSDLNYVLPLRWSMGLVVARLASSQGKLFSKIWMEWLVWLCLLPTLYSTGTLILAKVAEQERSALARATVEGQEGLLERKGLIRVVRSPTTLVLTDVVWLAAQQGPRAVMTDPYLFRILIERKTVDIEPLLQKIRNAEFAMVICRLDPAHPAYLKQWEALPAVVHREVIQRYRFQRTVAGLTIYVPKDLVEPARK